MEFVRAHGAREDEPILCPCARCLNVLRQSLEDVEKHINRNGMSITYTRWTYHGEQFSDDEGGGGDHGAYDSEDDDEFEDDNGNKYDDVPRMVQFLQECGKKDGSHHEDNIYAKLIEEAKRELHPGCTTYTRLTFIIKMLHIKSYTRTTNRAFDLFMQLLCSALPNVDFPKSYAHAKSVLSEVGLGYETIHVCKFDCALFWGDNANKTHCPVCGYSRWKDRAGKKNIPHKVLRYFPIIPRLQRFFTAKETSTLTKWHKE